MSRTRLLTVLILTTLTAPIAIAHDGPVDGHLVTGDPPGPWHRLIHDCAGEYGHHAGNGLTEWGHGHVNLDVRETTHAGEPVVTFYVVFDKQHPALRNVIDTRDTVMFDTPRTSISTTIQKVGAQVVSYHSGTEPVYVDGPLPVIDLEDAFGEDTSRYAFEFAYTYEQLQIANGEAITNYHAAGQHAGHAPGQWTEGDRMLDGYWDPLLSPLFGPVPVCDVGTDDDAFLAESFVVRQSDWMP